MGYSKWNDVSYDNDLFEVRTDDPARGQEYLHYKGSEMDARKIQVPPQLTSLYMMFAGTGVEYGPYIPDGVTDVRFMFEDASHLIEGSEVPDSVVHQTGMYNGCMNLADAKNISKNAQDIDYMFSGCRSLTRVPEIPDSVISASGAFSSCENVREVHGGRNIQNARQIYAGMQNLEIPSPEMNPEADMRDAFTGCTAFYKMMDTAGQNIPGMDMDFESDPNDLRDERNMLLYGVDNGKNRALHIADANRYDAQGKQGRDRQLDRNAMADDLVSGIASFEGNGMDGPYPV